MKWKKVKAAVLQVLGISSLPQKDGKLDLSEEQKSLLMEVLDDKKYENFEKMANAAIEQETELARLRTESQETMTELANLLADSGIEMEPEEEDEDEDPELESADTPKKPKANSASMIAKLKKELQEKKKQIELLSDDPEADLFELIHQKPGAMKHSNSHLFASGNAWDEFEGRAWNKRAAGIGNIGAENYTDLDVDQIKTDFGNYFKQDLDRIVSFLRGISRLPSFWGRLSNVQDEAWYMKLFVGEITQGRKKNWLPKGKFEFQPEKAKVYDIQIDLEFEGYELQKLEKTWIGRLNNEGASPFKMSFVAFLMMEVIKKRLEEDEMSLIRGVYVPTPEDSDTPGLFLQKCSGLLKHIQKAQLDRKYLPYDLGKPTIANIYDYVEAFVKKLPKYWRDLPGMVLYMDPDWEKAYHKRREEIKGTMPTYEPGKMTVDRYENIRIEPLHFGVGDFMFITPADNIDLLEGRPGEKNSFEMERAKRNLAVYADYRIGVHVYAFGYTWPEGVTMTDKKQLFFSNNVEIILDNYVQLEPGTTLPDAKYHNELQVGINTGATAITNVLNVAVGSFVYLYGNGTNNASTIANGGNFDLASNITLSENTMIKLYKRPDDGKLVEVYRNENLLKPEYVVLDAGAATADAAAGNRFITSANAGATAITNITNAVEGESYRLEGGSDANATTIAKSGNFIRISAAITLEDGNWIDVLYQGGKFIELGRNVA